MSLQCIKLPVCGFVTLRILPINIDLPFFYCSYLSSPDLHEFLNQWRRQRVHLEVGGIGHHSRNDFIDQSPSLTPGRAFHTPQGWRLASGHGKKTEKPCLVHALIYDLQVDYSSKQQCASKLISHSQERSLFWARFIVRLVKKALCLTF